MSALPVVDLAGPGCCPPLQVKALATPTAGRLAPMFKALSDPIRLRLLSLIASTSEVCVCDLTGAFEVTGATISHHLRVLRETGLVDVERRGTWAYYRVRRDALDLLGGLLTGQARPRDQNQSAVVGQVPDRPTPVTETHQTELISANPDVVRLLGDPLRATVTGDKRLLISSLVINWLIGPAVMFALAWIFLAGHAEYRTGLIVVGLARCIAMVVIWNDLACGDREAAAVLVALNSVFQVVAFGVLGWFYLTVLPGWLHLSGADLRVSGGDIARNVLIFLGIPLLAGYLTRRFGEKARSRIWYEERFLPTIGPLALYGLLFTIVILFALQGDAITSKPWDVALIAVPLLVYFAIMWGGSYALGRAIGLNYERTTTLAFTAAGNNFELAIAVAIGTFGVTSGQALAGVVGPLIEVPVLVGLVYISLALRRRFSGQPPAYQEKRHV